MWAERWAKASLNMLPMALVFLKRSTVTGEEKG